AVEHPNPRALDAAVLRALLIENGLPFAQIGIAAGDPAQGEKGLAALPEAVARFRDAVLRDLDYAVAIDCPFVQALAGIAPPDVAFARLWATYVENIAFAADAAAERGLGLLIEPICRQAVAGYVMSEAALAVRAILEANRPNIRLLFDSYHAANEGLDSPAF